MKNRNQDEDETYQKLLERYRRYEWDKLLSTWELLLSAQERNMVRREGKSPPNPESNIEQKLRILDKYNE